MLISVCACCSEYARSKKTKMCWLMMEEHFRAEGWFGLIMGSALWQVCFQGFRGFRV
jgi:hypothetical protein